MKPEYLWGQLASLDQILYEASLGWGKGCIRFWDRLDLNSGFHSNRKGPLTYNGENDVSTFSVVFYQIFFKLAGNEDRHTISDEFKFRPDRTTPYRVRCSWASEKISHRLTMGKWCLQASSFIFDPIFIKLTGNQERHKISDEFKFRPDWISHLGVTCPWGRFKFSIDLHVLWNFQVQLTFQMKKYWVHCGCNSSYSFPQIVLKLFRCFLHGMKMCMCFGYNPSIISFFTFSALWT